LYYITLACLAARRTGRRLGSVAKEAVEARSLDGRDGAEQVAGLRAGRRAQFLDGQLGRLDEPIVPLVTDRAPGLLALFGVGPAPRHCSSPRPGTTPSGCAARPQPGGDRQANHALWRIVFTRLGTHPATRAYAERRTVEGKSKAEIIRCLKRYLAREVYPPPPGRRLTPKTQGTA
jgi:hypothetical protein